jgi:hypothetical protein
MRASICAFAAPQFAIFAAYGTWGITAELVDELVERVVFSRVSEMSFSSGDLSGEVRRSPTISRKQ